MNMKKLLTIIIIPLFLASCSSVSQKPRVVKTYNKFSKAEAIKVGSIVTLEYVGKLKSTWKVFDSTKIARSVRVWWWQLVKWLDAALIWGTKWMTKNIEVAPKDWYWEKYSESEFIKAAFWKDADNLKVWSEYSLSPDMKVKIKEIKDSRIIVDVPNPQMYSWETLLYEVKILDVKNR